MGIKYFSSKFVQVVNVRATIGRANRVGAWWPQTGKGDLKPPVLIGTAHRDDLLLYYNIKPEVRRQHVLRDIGKLKEDDKKCVQYV